MWTLLTLGLMMGGKAAGQTKDDKLPQEKIRVTDDRPLTRIDTLGINIHPGPELAGQFIAKDMALLINKSLEENYKSEVLRHEWNHYKNYMFGSNLHRKSIEDAIWLAFLDELTSFIVDDDSITSYLISRDKPNQQKRNLLLEKIESATAELLSSTGYINGFALLAEQRYDTNPDLDHLDDYKHHTDSIQNDMLVCYVDDMEIDFKRFLAGEDILKIKDSILNTVYFKSMTDHFNDYDLNYAQNTNLKGLFSPALKMEYIIGLSKLGSLDLSKSAIDHVSIQKNIRMPQNTKFPESMIDMKLKDIKFSDWDLLDLSSYIRLISIELDNTIPWKKIILPDGLALINIKNMDWTGTDTLDLSKYKELVTLKLADIEDCLKFIKLPENIHNLVIEDQKAEIVVDISLLKESPRELKIPNGVKIISNKEYVYDLNDGHATESQSLDAKNIRNITTMGSIDLSQHTATDVNFKNDTYYAKNIKFPKNVQTLLISNVTLPNLDVLDLSNYDSLTYVDLHETVLSRIMLPDSLRILSFAKAGLTDVDILDLSKYKNLKILQFFDMVNTPRTIKLPQSLISLSIANSRIEAINLSLLPDSLNDLSLADVDLTGMDILDLSRYKSLKDLTLYDVKNAPTIRLPENLINLFIENAEIEALDLSLLKKIPKHIPDNIKIIGLPDDKKQFEKASELVEQKKKRKPRKLNIIPRKQK